MDIAFKISMRLVKSVPPSFLMFKRGQPQKMQFKQLVNNLVILSRTSMLRLVQLN